MISIDTDIMKELVRTTTNANEAIDSAVDALNKIAIHNDWGCREKDSINNYTSSNKNKIKILQGNSRAFLSVLRDASADFETTENSIGNMFQSVESLLSKFFSIPTMGIVQNTTDVSLNNNASINALLNLVSLENIFPAGGIQPSWLDSLGIFHNLGGDDCPNPVKMAEQLAKNFFSNYKKIESTNIFDSIHISKFSDIIFSNVTAPKPDLSNVSFSK